LKARLGTIKGSEVRKFRDSTSNSRMLSAEITSPKDVQSVELIMGQGEDINPEDDDVVVIIKISDAYKMGLLVDDGIEPDTSIEKGERELYSKQNGTRKAKIRLNKNSEIILNGGIDFAVSFNELKIQMDQLKTDLLAHVHPGVTSGASSTGPSATAFSVNVDNTKVEKVRL